MLGLKLLYREEAGISVLLGETGSLFVVCQWEGTKSFHIVKENER